ncbi:hypothetical protein GTP58_03975 [Duganella sp. CY15W]|uniref:hypothetical protein n=1 Tax=Duganella sp. CY15W TaxID=2692172 RepID=UPI001368E46F|nr:hypothetical protein [Duganella sp. CY15W]MYM27472.1 hypothetical protein [Duganella sp. CY15W]
MPTTTSFNIVSALRSINNPKAQAAENNFLNNGGIIKMVNSNQCNYVSGGHPVNSIETNGTIYIGTTAIDNYAAKMQISPLWAARDLAIHELGHAVFQQRDYETNPGDAAPLADKVSWCLTREAEASAFSFEVAVENHASGGNLHVPGTDSIPDLYASMLAAVGTLDPRSSQFELKAIAYAKQVFSNDPKYVAFCSNPQNWKLPAYIPPTPPNDGGGGGGGAGGGSGGGSGYVPEPGGYWQEVPDKQSTDGMSPPPSTSIVHAEIIGSAPPLHT